MSIALGKRKRPGNGSAVSRHTPKIIAKTREEEEEKEQNAIQAIFRQHFEAQFKPLPAPKPKPQNVSVDEEYNNAASEGEEWSGISEGENEALVIEHTEAAISTKGLVSRQELKAFLVSRENWFGSDFNSYVLVFKASFVCRFGKTNPEYYSGRLI